MVDEKNGEGVVTKGTTQTAQMKIILKILIIIIIIILIMWKKVVSTNEGDDAPIAIDGLLLWTMDDPVGIREKDDIDTDKEDEVGATLHFRLHPLTHRGGVVGGVLVRLPFLPVLVS